MIRFRLPLTLLGMAFAILAIARHDDRRFAWIAIGLLVVVLGLRVGTRFQNRAERTPPDE